VFFFLYHKTANNSTEHGEPGWWKEQFNCADEDGDGALNHTEFYKLSFLANFSDIKCFILKLAKC
jgi:Ca2+-binding EF-hand superfamily protein